MTYRKVPKAVKTLVLAIGATGVVLGAGLTAASGGGAGPRLAAPQTLTPLTVTKVADVTASQLPAASPTAGPAQAVPFRVPDEAAYAATKQGYGLAATADTG